MKNRAGMGVAARAGAAACVIAAGAALVGCPSPMQLGTARTLAPGRHSHTAGLEVTGFGSTYPTGSSTSGGAYTVLPMPPTYQARIGVHDRMDVGLRLSHLSSIGADLKINMLRGRVDLAVAPYVQGGFVGISVAGASAGGAILHANAPLLLGINASRAFSIVLQLGPGTMAVLGGGSSSSSSGGVFGAGARFGLRYGAGFNIRINDFFALHPEISGDTYFIGNGATANWVSGGLGLTFGAMPNFDDIGPPPPQAAPPPGAYPPPQPGAYPPPPPGYQPAPQPGWGAPQPAPAQ